MLRLENISFTYGTREILKNITCQIKKGHFYGIVGPNGAGKTTLLQLMHGSLSPTAGQLLYHNKPLHSYPLRQLAQNLALIPQQREIRFPYTCLEMVMLGRIPHRERLQSLSERDMELVWRYMSLTGTLEFADSLITHLSGGEKQRVMLAKALAQTPALLLLDEAFANMDTYQGIKSLKLLKKLVQEENLTVVCIMHDLNLVSNFCDYCIVLKEGSFFAQGPSEEVLRPEVIREVFQVQVVKAGARGLAVLPDIEQ